MITRPAMDAATDTLELTRIAEYGLLSDCNAFATVDQLPERAAA